jgi:hypothetical protein
LLKKGYVLVDLRNVFIRAPRPKIILSTLSTRIFMRFCMVASKQQTIKNLWDMGKKYLCVGGVGIDKVCFCCAVLFVLQRVFFGCWYGYFGVDTKKPL